MTSCIGFPTRSHGLVSKQVPDQPSVICFKGFVHPHRCFQLLRLFRPLLRLRLDRSGDVKVSCPTFVTKLTGDSRKSPSSSGQYKTPVGVCVGEALKWWACSFTLTHLLTHCYLAKRASTGISQNSLLFVLSIIKRAIGVENIKFCVSQ